MIKKEFFAFLSLSILIFLISFGSWQIIQAKETNSSLSCAVYFTGVGCPHCAKTDPVIFGNFLENHPNFIIIEYEVYRTPDNAQILQQYDGAYHLPAWQRGIPAVFLSKDKQGILVGDAPILNSLNELVSNKKESQCLLEDGSTKNFTDLELDSLVGKPKIWRQNRILVKQKQGTWTFAWNGLALPAKNSSANNTSQDLSALIIVDNFTDKLKTLAYTTLKGPYKVSLSGREVSFDHAVQLKTEKQPTTTLTGVSKLTIAKVASLASVDAINPCALAVLLLMLTTIITYNPGNKKRILLAGLAFTLSVFVGYFLYGLAIIKMFQFIQALAPVKLWLYRILGILAILLGLSNIKDFVYYKPGGVGTEMPLFLRPKVKKLLSKTTSPLGAAVIGILVTVFLLPCTIGPYFIAGGVLSNLQMWRIIPWLLFYNLIFVSPMVVITLLVYGGLSQVKDISQWKEKNITKIHLVEGLIMLILGGIMVLGLS